MAQRSATVRVLHWCGRHPWGAGVLAVLVVVVAAVGSRQGDSSGDAAGPSGSPSGGSSAVRAPAVSQPVGRSPVSAAPIPRTPRSPRAAVTVLAGIPVKGRAPLTGYDRSAFGPAWTDDTASPGGHNGCDTRNDILRRDLVNTQLKPGSNGCSVLRGTLDDPYTAATIDYVRGGSNFSPVQIDHVVSLGDAWQKGAQRWAEQTRADLANDPLNLLAVDSSANEAKGDGDAATWLPPNKAYRCAYVARQIAVKSRYRLWVTLAEAAAMTRVLGACPRETVPAEAGAPHIVHASPTGGPHPVYYPNCASVRAAGAAPLHRGEPGYDLHLDGDGDGIACEP